MIPDWLHLLAILSLGVAIACAVWIAWDVMQYPQHMAIMNLVWPITALFGSLAALWLYLRFGRLATRKSVAANEAGKMPVHSRETPFAAIVAKGATHCGSGCMLGDLVAEWLAFWAPILAVWFGWHSLFAEKTFAVWMLDYLFAFGLGIAFQYFTIKPMRDLSVREGILEAVKADFLSLTAWQVGMYGFMALAQFILFRKVFGVRLEVNTFEFWFMMQIAMIAGFATSYPINWWLISRGIKERM